MSQGLNLFSQAGGLTYSTLDTTWFLLSTFLLAANTSTTRSYAIPNGGLIRVQVQMINTPPASTEDYAPIVSIIGNSITVGPNSTGTSSASIITVLLSVGAG